MQIIKMVSFVLLSVIYISTAKTVFALEEGKIKYSNLRGAVYSFEDNNSIFRHGDMFSEVEACSIGRFCLKFDETIISIPDRQTLKLATLNTYLEHYPTNVQGGFYQEIEVKTLSVLGMKVSGFLINSYEKNNNVNLLKNTLFYTEQKGLIFFSYISKELNLNTKQEELVFEYLLSTTSKGLQ